MQQSLNIWMLMKEEKEAIHVKVKGLGKIGYVANSPFTVKGESMSAGRLYDKIGDKAKGKVVFVVDGGVVCRIINTGKEQNLVTEKEQNSDGNVME